MFSIGYHSTSTVELSSYREVHSTDKKMLTLLFIHGLESCKETWVPLISKIQDRYNIFSIDLRGHGESPPGEDIESLTIWTFVADIDRFVRKNGLCRFVLIAHSMGARIAIAYASLYPEKIRNLVIEDMELTPRLPLQLTELQVNNLKKFNPFQPTLEDVEREIGRYGYDKKKYEAWLEAGKIKWIKDQERYFIHVHPYIKYLSHNACLASIEVEEAFKKFYDQKLSVLLIQAEKESSITVEGLEQMYNLLPTLQVKKIAGSFHNIHKTQTYDFIECLDSYLLETS